MIVCKKCGIEKSLDSFTKSLNSKDGVKHICKSCNMLYMRIYRINNRTKVGKSDYKSALKTRYNLTENDYQNLLEQQDYKCKICSVHQDSLLKRLHVDHCHKTLKIRGLLCNDCNKVLGMFKDNPERFLKASLYLNQ
jgi:ABC-type ATPase with predicted acetyltransferase domain